MVLNRLEVMRGIKFYGLALVILLSMVKASAQAKPESSDSTTQVATTKHHLTKPDKAAIMSAIIPGLGQIGYNDSWWHVPVIYAGFAVMGYAIYYNNTQYNIYRTAYTNSVMPDGASNGDILQNREYYRRNRDLTIIIASVWYAANILDAYVSAHLREFDISNNLAMNIEPLNISMLGSQPVVTCGLKLNLR
jgi:hypothetical protein